MSKLFLGLFICPWVFLTSTTSHGCEIPDVEPLPTTISLTAFVTGLEFPVKMLQDPAQDDTFYILEKKGIVRRVVNGRLEPAAFFDMGNEVYPVRTANDERGLLGMAFHPDFPRDRRVFFNFVDTENQTVIRSYEFSADGRLRQQLPKDILKIAQPYANHNGGEIAFGPDGFLYIGMGDGGRGGDPGNRAQNLDSLFGKMLRIDINVSVNELRPYRIPRDNPFLGAGNARPEIYAYGLRNPWRFSFDSLSGALYAGDVGQSALEEVDQIESGKNYGWRIMEGDQCFNPNPCQNTGLTLPLISYPRGDGVSITGGFVYRGTSIPSLIGHYIFGDFGSGKIWGFDVEADLPANEKKLLLASGVNISAFAQDRLGEVFVIDYGNGGILKLAPSAAQGGLFPQTLSATECFEMSEGKPIASFKPFAVNSPLWSNGSTKTRFVRLPEGQKMTLNATNSGASYTLPQGTILLKNFYFDAAHDQTPEARIFETRFLVIRETGFDGYTYRWNDSGTEAFFLAGALEEVKEVMIEGRQQRVRYHYPSPSECKGCHTASSGGPLGLTVLQTNRLVDDAGGQGQNQINRFVSQNMLHTPIPSPASLPSLVDYRMIHLDLEDRVGSYFHSQCSHCHNPENPQNPSSVDLRFAIDHRARNLIGVRPEFDDLGLGNGFLVDPGNSDNSVLLRRLLSERREVVMPPLSSSLIDQAGVRLITDWIEQL